MKKYLIKTSLIFILILIGVSIYYSYIPKNYSASSVNLSENPLADASEEYPEVGYKAPDFSLPSIDGRKIFKLSELKGKVVFLNIWATWCGPCRIEMPSMEKIYQKLRHKDFEMLAVSIDTKEEEAVSSFISKYGLTFPVLLDKKNEVVNLYQAFSIPQTYIIDKRGVVIAKILGARDWDSPQSAEALLYLIEDAPSN